MENKVGRPTKYDANYHPAQALKFCLAGLTDAQMANLFEITEGTLNNWKNEHPEFLESIKKGKEEADANVASTLYKRALGHKEKRQVPIKVKQYDEHDRQIEKVEVVEVEDYYPPETSAQIFWLKNRQPKAWRDRQDIELNQKGSINISDWLKINNQQEKE
ncbi:terminase [Riemerella anatipestifer]|uniref:terminase n=3 Tax=Riemerella anatipestifer TaxID=34085 RepID=UPI001C1DD156|nr:terminase [Riemerella anatipestifer]WCS66376.1 hypothetical protein CRP5_000021 [Riemerella phage vB_RanS_CRP5]WIL01316.1 hypothetical protein CRP6_000036 [Riemerella phage vB_RanS_CRP6]MCU7583617.1 terminase [Riemerella anatipestifer]MCW0487070.1 terminase [Riemerella anatipestifer]MCW0491014.1 terminase [Riemerella anatipestifer]